MQTKTIYSVVRGALKEICLHWVPMLYQLFPVDAVDDNQDRAFIQERVRTLNVQGLYTKASTRLAPEFFVLT